MEDLREKNERDLEHNVRGQESYRITPWVTLYYKCHCSFYTSSNMSKRKKSGKKKRADGAVTNVVFRSFLPQSFNQYLVPSCLIQLNNSVLFFTGRNVTILTRAVDHTPELFLFSNQVMMQLFYRSHICNQSLSLKGERSCDYETGT